MLRIEDPICTRSVRAARYPIRVGESKPYASGTQITSMPAFSSAATWSAEPLGSPPYITVVLSRIGPPAASLGYSPVASQPAGARRNAGRTSVDDLGPPPAS